VAERIDYDSDEEYQYAEFCEIQNREEEYQREKYEEEQEYIRQLESENVMFKAGLEKAVDFAKYVNNQFGYCMPQEFVDKYNELMKEIKTGGDL